MLNERIILIGNRNYETGLYEVNIDEQGKPKEKIKIQFVKQEKTKDNKRKIKTKRIYKCNHAH